MSARKIKVLINPNPEQHLPKTHPTENIENIPHNGQLLVPHPVHRVPHRVGQQQTHADKLQHQADREESRNGVLLQPHGVDLHRDHHQVDHEEDQVHLQRVLAIEREVKQQRVEEGHALPVRVPIDQLDVEVELGRFHVVAAVVVVVPPAGRLILVAGHQRDVPESGRRGEEGELW